MVGTYSKYYVATLLLTFSPFLAKARVGIAPDWFPRIQQDFTNRSFPLKKCPKRNNIAPLDGSRCGPKSKTCFFGDQICGTGSDAFTHPTQSCTCNGERGTFGIWKCQPEPCAEETECIDEILESRSWVDVETDDCIAYEVFGLCGFGNPMGVGSNLTADDACCACGGGVINPVNTSQCTDLSIVYDPPLLWTDSVGDNCSWYTEETQTRCTYFGNELNSNFNLSVVEACCACNDLVPLDNPTCTDLEGWTTADGRTCSEMLKSDCQGFPEFSGVGTENFGFTPVEACCKCGGGSDNPSTPLVLNAPTQAYTAGLCSSDSSKFNMCIKIGPNMAPQDIAAIAAAESRWSSVIVADNSPDFVYDFASLNMTFPFLELPEDIKDLNAFYSQPEICGYNPGFSNPNVTDDLSVCISQSVKRLPGILADAAPLISDSFARFGVIDINADAVRSLRSNDTLYNIVLHEFGHVLGIGTLWQDVNVTGREIQDLGTCSYLGENANRVYQEISGCSATPVPLEPAINFTLVFPNFTLPILYCGGHLDEDCFGSELMTPSVRGATEFQLSTITVALLEDLGYAVDYSQADAYTKADLNASCVCNDDAAATVDGRSMLQEEEEETVTPRSTTTSKRPLSDEGFNTIVEYATNKLKVMNAVAMSYMMNADDDVAVGIPGIMVLYMEEGEMYSEYVVNSEMY